MGKGKEVKEDDFIPVESEDTEVEEVKVLTEGEVEEVSEENNPFGFVKKQMDWDSKMNDFLNGLSPEELEQLEQKAGERKKVQEHVNQIDTLISACNKAKEDLKSGTDFFGKDWSVILDQLKDAFHKLIPVPVMPEKKARKARKEGSGGGRSVGKETLALYKTIQEGKGNCTVKRLQEGKTKEESTKISNALRNGVKKGYLNADTPKRLTGDCHVWIEDAGTKLLFPDETPETE